MLIGIIIAIAVAVSRAGKNAVAGRPQLPLAQCPRCYQQHWTPACSRCGWPRNTPFYYQPPQYAPPPSQQIIHHTHTIERHIVLVRCRYCSTQTRIDAGTCRNCGAANFAS